MPEELNLAALVEQHLAKGGAITKLDYAGNVVGQEVAPPAPAAEAVPADPIEAPDPAVEAEPEEPEAYATKARRALRKIRSVAERLNSVLDDFPR